MLLNGKMTSFRKFQPRQASTLSCETLVICPVSLVGQWIEKAKSKQEDPSIVYSHHGQNHKRDANIPAKHAIVVATCQVVASDNTCHRTKSQDENYCLSLEQIQCWRIVCDEGHLLQEAKTKGTAQSPTLQLITNCWCQELQ